MKLIDPTGKVPEQTHTCAPRLAMLDGKVIGLLSNGKANADLLLTETAERFRRAHGCEVLEIVYKPNPSAPAPSEIIDGLAERCDFLLTANGD